MKTSEQTNEIFKALSLFRKQLVQPVKDAKNPFFKSNYVTLDGVVKAIDDAIVGTGLSYNQETTSEGSNVKVATHITHESGQFMSFDGLSLPASKADPQGFGSAITYAKRYALAAAFGVTSDIDDDGNKANETAPKRISNRDLGILKTLITNFGKEFGMDFDKTYQTIQKRTNIFDDIDKLTAEQSGIIKNFINENKKA